ncbi:MAG: TIGR00299 family protein [Acidobacteria bacterium RIFCSPLOWO2_12_FULL_65_11]|nr:MAG: TIGR00299 family protein [Acidobacteria bacterium RIFCSPLOWO2_02_FULL_64_15]OFW33794.1 MAG: TIGR00299 family protein [Acidobacteria bacterium RIFCSPLOWO2_12_FULL_65_11]
MKVLYLDCFSGISGDMALGALIDAGLPLDDLKRALGSLAVSGFEVSAERVLRAGVSATKFTVREHSSHSAPTPLSTHAPTHDHHHDHPHHSLSEIFALIDKSALSQTGRDRAKAMFQRLGEVEAAIHQMPVEKVHLHEVGALDSIIDIVGTVFALEWVGADRVVCSPLNVGGGTVKSAHGTFPVPAPATVKLLGSAPIYAGTVQHELVTPTGALIASSYAGSFGPIPSMTVERVGYGAGERDHADRPNLLRVLIGRATEDAASERVTMVECEIDDMNPQIFGVVMDRLYAAGALEVFYVPVQMKKNRPGTLLTVIVAPERRPQIADVIFRETTTIGLRYYDVNRECLDREMATVDTPLGAVRFKISSRDGCVMNAVPEFEDCAALAAANNLSVKEVQALAVHAYGTSERRRDRRS